MRILITNDDGIHAPGLEACETIARALSDEVWIVAPESDQSGVSHSLSLNDPLRLREVGATAFRGQGHADRLRHHGRAPSDAADAGPGALRRQPRAQRRRGRDLFGHGRRRHGRHRARHSLVLAVAGLCLHHPARAALGDGDQIRARSDPPRAQGRHAARRAGQRQFSRLPARAKSPALPSSRRASATRNCCASTRATTGAAIRITGSPSAAAASPARRPAAISPRSTTSASRSRRCGST